jgi:hypothetical protein
MVLAMSMGHFLFAQEPVYKWGEPCTNENLDRQIEQLLNLGDEGFAVLKSKTGTGLVKTYWIEQYDSNLKLTETNRVDFAGGVMGDSYDITEIHQINGTIYAFVEHWHKAYGHNTIHVRELSVDGKMTDIAELDIINAKKMMNRGKHRMSFSPDGKKLIVLSELPGVKKTNENFRITCFEVDGMKKLWSHEKETKWPSKKYYNQEVFVNNNGEALIFKRNREKSVWYYSIYTIGESGEMTDHSNSLLLEGLEMEDYQFEFNSNNELIGYATITNKGAVSEKRVHGSWFAKFDVNMGLKTVLQNDWDATVLTEVGGERLAGKKDPFLSNFGLKDVLFREDGNILVLLEKVRAEKEIVPGSQPIGYRYEWEYGGVLTLALNPESGEILWSQFFDKVQKTKNGRDWDEYGSFVYHLNANRLFILWNATELSVASIPPANWTEPDGTRYVKHKAFDEKTAHATFMHVIEPDGSMAYDNRKFGLPLFTMHAGAVFPMSMSARFFFESNGMLVLRAAMNNGGKRYRYGLVDLK